MRLDPLLQGMAELDEIARRVEELRKHLADAIVTMGDRRDLERHRPRFEEPNHDAPAVPCCDYAERAQNEKPETHTHDVALDEDYTERLDACGE